MFYMKQEWLQNFLTNFRIIRIANKFWQWGIIRQKFFRAHAVKLECYLSGRKRKQQSGPIQKGAIVLEKRVSQDCLTLKFVHRKNGYPKDSLQIGECASHKLSCEVFYSLFSNLFICFKETTIRNMQNIHKIKQGILCEVKILGQPDKIYQGNH